MSASTTGGVLLGLTTAEVSLIVAGIALTGVVAGSILTSLLGRMAEVANRRRDSYASAVSTLVAWAEYPYRIRRRTSDAPLELTRLAELGHGLQERLRCHETWIKSESTGVGDVFHEVLVAITGRTGPAAKEAWDSPPIATATGMNLNGWGPVDSSEDLARLQSAITCRFGVRRLRRFRSAFRGNAPAPRSSPG